MMRSIGYFIAVLFMISGSAALAEDEITFHDRAQKKEVTVSGTIQTETAGKIIIKLSTGKTREILVPDIGEVMYNVPPRFKIEYRAGLTAEQKAHTEAKADLRQKDLTKALAKYQQLLTQVTGETVKAHFEYKIAQLTAQLAEDDSSKVNEAVDLLKKFRAAHPTAWQISPATDLLARLLINQKDWTGAQAAYASLENAANLTPAMRQDVALKMAQVLMKAGKYPEAEKRLQDIAASLPPQGPERTQQQLVLAQCQAASGKADDAVKALETVIPNIADPEQKAKAYNALGDCQRAAKRPKDAVWAYLWVDVVYNQNRQEHARALYHLAHLFQEIKDGKRAEEYRNKLKGTQFAGLEYQKMLVQEK